MRLPAMQMQMFGEPEQTDAVMHDCAVFCRVAMFSMVGPAAARVHAAEQFVLAVTNRASALCTILQEVKQYAVDSRHMHDGIFPPRFVDEIISALDSRILYWSTI